MSFKVLDADNPEWGDMLAALPVPLRDVHYTAAYGKIYQHVYDFVPKLAVWQKAAGVIIKPFVIRPLNSLPFLEGAATHYADIANPYGYGGALASNDDIAKEYNDFDAAFVKHAREQNYASEFCSLHPLLIDSQLAMVERAENPSFQKNVFSTLLQKDGDLSAQFSQGHRRNIRKAIAAGVSVEKVELTPENFKKFQDIYIYTMNRHSAASRWFFPDEYFPACTKFLGTDNTALFFAYYQGQLASACYLMQGHETAYYHFGGSYEEFYDVKASNYLMAEAMQWAKSAGYKNFHFGGGVTNADDDKLAQFKRGFGAAEYKLYTTSRILCQKTYEDLCAHKLEYEQKTAITVGNQGFFPLYRR